MTSDRAIQELAAYLDAGDFPGLFIERLGWNHTTRRPVSTLAGTVPITFEPVAEKEGFVVYVAASDADFPTRQRLHRELSKHVAEHFVIYVNNDGVQHWQWTLLRAGRAPRLVMHQYHPAARNMALLQRLAAIGFELSEEGTLTLLGVRQRVDDAFSAEEISKRFYDVFRSEHQALVSAIEGLSREVDQHWYASVLLNRLMFLYFVQKKGFLDGDIHYLRNRFRRLQELRGRDQFYSFFKDFLLPLFHDVLGSDERETIPNDPELVDLVGDVPYVNGGLFSRHDLERDNEIRVSDEVFESIFDLFDRYRWHLAEGPDVDDTTISPDVLGYVFEKYINQKEKGAYYTKQDVTRYMTVNALMPAFLHRWLQAAANDNAVTPPDWSLIQSDPRRYLPDELVYGLGQPAGTSARNEHIPEPLAHPTESSDDVLIRHARAASLIDALSETQLVSPRDAIASNVDLLRFAVDCVLQIDDAATAVAVFRCVRELTILDPTCGSGAFLFAALEVLDDLYGAAIEALRANTRVFPHAVDALAILEEIDSHPNTRYFVTKSAALHNLYGVDIMPEAVEIAKLRLFLHLVSEVETIEPLPDLDMNLRAGNTVVGFISGAEAEEHFSRRLDGQDIASIVREQMTLRHNLYEAFVAVQMLERASSSELYVAKAALKAAEQELAAILDQALANERGIAESEYAAWLEREQPFHWFLEFGQVVAPDTGFDAIIGNPPYLQYSARNVEYTVDEADFKTFESKNLYAYVFERSLRLAADDGTVALIVPLTITSSEKAQSLQDMILRRGDSYWASFPRRPESIFDGVEMPVSIVISLPADRIKTWTTGVQRFYSDERPYVFGNLQYTDHEHRIHKHRIAKIGSELESGILHKVHAHTEVLGMLAAKGGSHVVYYQEACRYWLKAQVGYPFFRKNGTDMVPSHGRVIRFDSLEAAAFATCMLNSSLFYWFYSAYSDCEHVNANLVAAMPVPPGAVAGGEWQPLWESLAQSLVKHSRRKTINTRQGHTIEYDEMKAVHSKPDIDLVDAVLAKAYSLSDDEAAFIVNYDLNYRMAGAGDDTA